MAAKRQTFYCPSAQPDMTDARILGVVCGGPDGPRVAYVKEKVTPTLDLLEQASPALPDEIFRFAAECDGSKCVHFDGMNCQLAVRIVEQLSKVTGGLPPCSIRSVCKWYHQEGKESCLRCPQVVTANRQHNERLRQVANGP